MKTLGVTDYTNQAPSKHHGRKNTISSTPVKMKVLKVHKIGGAHLQCVNSHYA